mgnify:CR=1 FL=1
MRDYKYILFDLDGTLTDPKEGITKSVAYALKHFWDRCGRFGHIMQVHWTTAQGFFYAILWTE